jgi:hypothetical protein
MVLLIVIHLNYGKIFYDENFNLTEQDMIYFNDIGMSIFIIILFHALIFILLEFIRLINLVINLC